MFNAEKGLLTNPEPPDDEFCIVANCGHEIYEGDEIVEGAGKTQCVECFLDEVYDLPVSELAGRFEATLRVVTKEARI